MVTGVTLTTKSPENLINFSIIETDIFYKLQLEFANKQILWSSLGTISIGQLNTLLHLHFQPINVVVFHESHWQK